MAEPNSGGTQGGPGQPKELSMELRLLLAFILMGVVLFLTPYFYKTVSPPVKKTAVAAKTEPAPSPSGAAPASVETAAVPNAPSAVPPVAAQQEETRVIDTDDFRVTFTNHGGVVKSWLLKKYKAHSGAPLELVNTRAHTDLPGSFYFPLHNPSVDLNQALYKVDTDGLAVHFDFSNGVVVAHKTFQFAKSSYLLNVSTEVTEGGKPLPSEIVWRGGFGDMGVTNPAGAQQTLRFDLTDSKLVKSAAKVAKDHPATVTGNYSFAGIEDQYFVAAFLPEKSASVEMTTFSDNAATPLETKELAFAGVGVGDGSANRFSLYVGPKDIDTLRAVNPRLEQVVDFGWPVIATMAKYLFLAVNWIAHNAIHNYGWSIIVVTIILNFLLLPLKMTSMKSMKKMQALQPQIAAINDKYKNVGLRDPRKADQNQEVMDLYKKYGVNPMGGCVPMLLQFPLIIAFYRVFSVSVEMRGASWLWVTDLSQPETLAIHILPIIMIFSQFVMQKMTPTAPGSDPNQQKMLMIMPLVFGFMFYNFSSGLVLYYLTSNLVGIAQQWFFNRTSLAAVAAQSVQPPKKKKDGKK
jgi:YidC/Oxa1 family membrane protein insertase